MSIITPNPPGTLFDAAPWYAHRAVLNEMLARETDEDICFIIGEEIEAASEMIMSIEGMRNHRPIESDILVCVAG